VPADPAKPLTWTGTLLLIAALFPNLPLVLSPQVQAVPSPFKARLKSAPPATAVAPVSPLTWTGTLLFVVPVFPNSPAEFKPQAQAVPSFFNARL
jgi:hypothetical protein